MTLFVPNTDEPKPCVVYFPGGGFTTSDYGKWSRLRMAMALQGFVVAAVEYRAIPDPFPAILIDGKTAIRYLRAHAVKFGIDGNRIGVMGNSAGGYLANLVTMTADVEEFNVGDFLDYSSDTQACCDIFGPTDLASVDEGFPPEVHKYHKSPSATEATSVKWCYLWAKSELRHPRRLGTSTVGKPDGLSEDWTSAVSHHAWNK